MFGKKILFVLMIALALGAALWAGDTAVFADLGFSPDGKTYMFAQYGVQTNGLKPWADLFVVDVPLNNFVPGGRISYVHDAPVVAGQDGSGALYRLIAGNTALANRYNVNYLFQGQPLYLSLDEPAAAPITTVDFRDFENGASYQATLAATVEGAGPNLKSSFYITLNRTAKDGTRRIYTVGNPQIKRPDVASYRIRKVMIAPRDGSMIFVIEMKKQGASGHDIRFMVEALRL